MTPRLNETAPFNRVSSCHSQATVITLAFFLAVFITFTGFWVGHWFWKKKRNNVSVDDSVGLLPFQRMEEEVWISLTQWKLRVKGTWTFGMLFGLHVLGFSFSFSNYCFTLPCPTPATQTPATLKISATCCIHVDLIFRVASGLYRGQGKEEQTNALAYDIYSTGIPNSNHEQKFTRETKDISVPRCEPKRHFSGHDSLSRFHLFLGSTYPHFSGLPLLIAHSSSHHSHSSGLPFLIAPSSSHHSSASLPIFQIKRGKWEEDS